MGKIEYKGFECSGELSGSGRFNGIRVYLYNNRNGKYGYIELGKSYDHYRLSNVPCRKTLEHLFKISVDRFETERQEYKFSLDFIAGIESFLKLSEEEADIG